MERTRTGRRKGSTYWTCRNEERWLALRWYEIVGSEDERHLKAGVSWEVAESDDGGIRYMCTHGAKRAQKKVPDGYTDVGKFWGRIGKIRVERVGVCRADGETVFNAVGHSALSSKGKIKKYQFDAAGKFSADEL